MPPTRNDERRTNNGERKPMTDRPKNLSFLTSTSVMNLIESISYLLHILTPSFAETHGWERKISGGGPTCWYRSNMLV
jgi:hypothetical protein